MTQFTPIKDTNDDSSIWSEKDMENQGQIGESELLSGENNYLPSSKAPRSKLNEDENAARDKTLMEYVKNYRTTSKFLGEKSFECQVIDVDKNEFDFKAVDPVGIEKEFVAKFEINEVPEEDRELIRKGAEFYWSIGYFSSPSTTQSKQMDIRFRRVSKWTEKSNKKALEKAGELMNDFGWSDI